MLIVVPMAGKGERFIRAGYVTPKPLIVVDGKPIIEHVVDMFPDSDYFFICNTEHLAQTNMQQELERVAPLGRIVGIPTHKRGPTFSIIQVSDHIPDEEPVIVTFCDYTMAWDYEGFKRMAERTQCDGAIMYYTGFHPHLLRNQFYGTILAGEDGHVSEFKEKHRFDPDPLRNKHNPGAYYFKTGKLLKQYCAAALRTEDTINGEHFMHTVFQLMIADRLAVQSWSVQFFCQWGTPEDLAEYKTWAGAFTEGRAQTLAARTPDGERIYTYWKTYFTQYRDWTHI